MIIGLHQAQSGCFPRQHLSPFSKKACYSLFFFFVFFFFHLVGWWRWHVQRRYEILDRAWSNISNWCTSGMWRDSVDINFISAVLCSFGSVFKQQYCSNLSCSVYIGCIWLWYKFVVFRNYTLFITCQTSSAIIKNSVQELWETINC
mgnify:CR=1 FL=1